MFGNTWPRASVEVLLRHPNSYTSKTTDQVVLIFARVALPSVYYCNLPLQSSVMVAFLRIVATLRGWVLRIEAMRTSADAGQPHGTIGHKQYDLCLSSIQLTMLVTTRAAELFNSFSFAS